MVQNMMKTMGNQTSPNPSGPSTPNQRAKALDQAPPRARSPALHTAIAAAPRLRAALILRPPRLWSSRSRSTPCPTAPETSPSLGRTNLGVSQKTTPPRMLTFSTELSMDEAALCRQLCMVVGRSPTSKVGRLLQRVIRKGMGPIAQFHGASCINGNVKNPKAKVSDYCELTWIVDTVS